MTELKKILLVEDEPDIQTVAQMALETVGGFEVQVRGDGAQGVAAALEWAPDLVMLDVMMPSMDGPTALGKLRESEAGKRIPVIFMTAKVQKGEIQEYLDLGAVGVISKPFDPMTLAEQVKAIWEKVHG